MARCEYSYYATLLYRATSFMGGGTGAELSEGEGRAPSWPPLRTATAYNDLIDGLKTV